MARRSLARFTTAALLALLAACTRRPSRCCSRCPPRPATSPPHRAWTAAWAPRRAPPPASTAMARRWPAPARPGRRAAGGGEYSLDFADTDIREAVGADPRRHAERSTTPSTRRCTAPRRCTPRGRCRAAAAAADVAGAAGRRRRGAGRRPDGLTRVVPAAAAGAAGATVVPLRYASAEELAKVLQPLAGANAQIAAEPGRNAW